MENILMAVYNLFLSKYEMQDWNLSGLSSSPAREGIFLQEVEASSAALAVNAAQEKLGHDLDGVWHAWLASNDESSNSLP